MNSFQYYLYSNGIELESYIEHKTIDTYTPLILWNMSYYRWGRMLDFTVQVHKDSKSGKTVQYIKDRTKKDSEYIRTVLPDMKLDLSYFLYRDSKPSDIVILNKDSKSVKYNEGDGYYSIESTEGDELMFTDDTEVFCNKKAKIYKIYLRDKVKDISKEDPIEALYYTDNGFVSFDYVNGNILSYHNMTKNNNSYRYIYKKATNSEFYTNSYKVEEVYNTWSGDIEDSVRKYKVVYDEDDFVKDVILEYSKDNPDAPKSYCKYYRQENNELIYSYAIYPTGVTDNINNYRFDYGELWNYDEMIMCRDANKVISFCRTTYRIDVDLDNFAKGLEDVEFKEGLKE